MNKEFWAKMNGSIVTGLVFLAIAAVVLVISTLLTWSYVNSTDSKVLIFIMVMSGLGLLLLVVGDLVLGSGLAKGLREHRRRVPGFDANLWWRVTLIAMIGLVLVALATLLLVIGTVLMAVFMNGPSTAGLVNTGITVAGIGMASLLAGLILILIGLLGKVSKGEQVQNEDCCDDDDPCGQRRPHAPPPSRAPTTPVTT